MIRQLLRPQYSTKINCKVIPVIFLIGLLIFFGCSRTQKVLMPPKIDLKGYRAIGIIDFSTETENDMQEYVTQKFIESVQSAQPGVRFLELGSKDLVLTNIHRKQLDPEAIKAIGRIYHVDALIHGHFNVSDPTPNVHLSSTWQSVRAGADVEASLMAKLWETESGVILWTNSSMRKQSVARLKADTSGNIRFGASDPEETYGRLVPELVYANTVDFRSYYEYRKIN